MLIYKITNKITFESYIGQTVQSLNIRWKGHCSPSSECTYLARAIQKYGKENFEIKVIARCDSIEEMNHREQYYIKLFNTLAPNGYNLQSGGGNRMPHPDTRAKLSKAMSNRTISRETKRKVGDSKRGNKHHFFGKTALNVKQVIELSTGIVFKSVTEAANAFGISRPEISLVCTGKLKSAKGKSFSFVDSY